MKATGVTPALDARELLTRLLEQVSRSFYLTLRVLPASIRRQIGLAYLLARTTDTVADTEIVPVDQRTACLEMLRDRILGHSNGRIDFSDLARNQGSPAERVLLEQVDATLALLDGCEPSDRDLIRRVLDTITSGQLLDLRRFAGASPGTVVSLQTDEELEDYTYRVAGCVGEFWTKICVKNQFGGTAFLARQGSGPEEFERLGIRFGKGLQLVNILRDLPADLRNGRCYVPEQTLASAGLKPADLLQAENEPRFRAVYHGLLDRARGHLSAGWDYTNRIPRSQVRIRLACAWPILIGIDTVKRLRASNILDAGQRVKISRSDVRGLVFRSVLMYPLPAWRKLPGL